MSRHRDFKGNNLDYGDYDSHSNSVTDDENYGASPNTMALYMFDESKSGKSREIINYINYNPSLNISEDCFPDQDNEVFVSQQIMSMPIVKEVEIPKSFKKVPEMKQKPKSTDFGKVKETLIKLSLDNKEDESVDIVEKVGDKVQPDKLRAAYDAGAVQDAYDNANKQNASKPLVSMIVIGHVDAGKSTLMGNLLCQLNYVSDKKLTKYKHEAQKAGKASFAYAWILDESAEERSRGITTDVGQTHFETKNRKIRLLDAPGHKDFIPNMIAGASQADAAILVVNATRGEFESGFDFGGQTREHASLIRVYGISTVIVAVNKMDTVDWCQIRYDEICDKMRKFMKSVRLTPQFCPVSGMVGTNVTDESGCETQNRASTVMPWYQGPSLVDLINGLELPSRCLEKPLRVTVTDVFKPLGSGSYSVSGLVEAGGVWCNSKVLCMPMGIVATVKSIKVTVASTSDEAGTCGEVSVPHAFDGDQVLLTMVGIDVNLSLEPGSILCHPEYPITSTNRVRAKLLVFGLKNNKVITRGYTAVFYFQSISVPVRFEKLHSATVREGKIEVVKTKPRVLCESCSAEVDLLLDKAICIETYDNYKNLAKFTIRECGNTIAGGTVIKLLKSKLR